MDSGYIRDICPELDLKWVKIRIGFPIFISLVSRVNDAIMLPAIGSCKVNDSRHVYTKCFSW